MGSVDESLRTAIQDRRVIQLYYRGLIRVVEPHDYGIQNDTARLLAYQIGGGSSGKLPNWRWFDVDGISDIELLDRTFPGGRAAPSGKHHKWDVLFIRVEQPKALSRAHRSG